MKGLKTLEESLSLFSFYSFLFFTDTDYNKDWGNNNDSNNKKYINK